MYMGIYSLKIYKLHALKNKCPLEFRTPILYLSFKIYISGAIFYYFPPFYFPPFTTFRKLVVVVNENEKYLVTHKKKRIITHRKYQKIDLYIYTKFQQNVQ